MQTRFVVAASILLALTSVACGGAQAHPEKDDHAHGKMSPALHEFHEVLGPAWHSKAGAERVGKACTAGDEMVAKAKATQDSSLIALTASMKAECDDPQRDEVEAWLGKVHHRFHELTEK